MRIQSVNNSKPRLNNFYLSLSPIYLTFTTNIIKRHALRYKHMFNIMKDFFQFYVKKYSQEKIPQNTYIV